jgi:16S rRNA (adenine(1408)-N(1))-methyltransferase
LAAGFARVAIDLGTGDGRHVLAAAAARPDTLVIGVDANAAGMAEASRRATRRNALPNALFAVAAAERPPQALRARAHSLTITFPWGSLLRGVLGHDDAVLAGVAALLAPGSTARVLVSVVPRDGVPEIPPDDRLAAAYAAHGLELLEARPATAEEVAASGSSWAKRLRAGAARPVTLLRLGMDSGSP